MGEGNWPLQVSSFACACLSLPLHGLVSLCAMPQRSVSLCWHVVIGWRALSDRPAQIVAALLVRSSAFIAAKTACRAPACFCAVQCIRVHVRCPRIVGTAAQARRTASFFVGEQHQRIFVCRALPLNESLFVLPLGASQCRGTRHERCWVGTWLLASLGRR